MHLALLIVALSTLGMVTYLGVAIMSNQDQIDAVAARLEKARTEILDAIEDLKNQPPESLDFTVLEAAAGSLDDIVPDEGETPAGA